MYVYIKLEYNYTFFLFQIVELTDEIRADIKSGVVGNMASKALRTIGVAYK